MPTEPVTASRLRLVYARNECANGSDAPTAREIDIRDDSALSRLASWYPTPSSWWRCNAVVTLDGRLAGMDGTSNSLTSPVDRAVLRHLRNASDAVLMGAETIRQEPALLTPGVRILVLTATGDLTGHRITPERAKGAITIVCPESATDTAMRTMPGATVLPSPTDGAGRVDLSRLRSSLSDRGIGRVTVEGGANVISACLESELLDEACLTQTPAFGSANAPVISANETSTWHREMVAVDDAGLLYTRLVR